MSALHEADPKDAGPRDRGEQTGPDGGAQGAPLVRDLAALDRHSLSLAGGKGANLGELLRAGFPVTHGFCLTTAAYERVAGAAGLDDLLQRLATAPSPDVATLESLAEAVRTRLLAAPIPDDVAAAVGDAYRRLAAAPSGPSGSTAPAVAVRSSATAEDLPGASFAGQQDTELNVVGEAAVLESVRRCWASLWTGRATTYRAANGIDPHGVALAVVVQRMVDAAVAGVLFTANPITGKRHQAVLDASPGLGEAVVSGAVTPDHFVVETASGQIVERRAGDGRLRIEAIAGGGTRRVDTTSLLSAAGGTAPPRRLSLSDDQVRALARLGARVEAHFGTPQDVEWAVDGAGTLWLTQARPITTLYPLPEVAAGHRGTHRGAHRGASEDALRVYFSVNVAQGVFRPFTPMGMQALRLLVSGGASLWGLAPRDPLQGPAVLVDAGERLFIDVTGLVRNRLGRRAIQGALGQMEARSAPILKTLLDDPRLAPQSGSLWGAARAWGTFFARTRLPIRIVHALIDPDWGRRAVTAAGAAALTAERAPLRVPTSPAAPPAVLLDGVERLLCEMVPHLVPGVIPIMVAGLGAAAAARRLLAGLATDDEQQTVMRGLPYNVTTEMDLQLWALAELARADPPSAAALRTGQAEALVAAYKAGTLPPILQTHLRDFLDEYGHRGVAEIDLGLPRWSDDPSHILGTLANYLRLEDADGRRPDSQFRAAVQSAEAMVRSLSRRAARQSWWRGIAVRFLLGRARRLAGMRESPKFYFVAALAQARDLLDPVGAALVAAGALDDPAEIYFLTIPEARVGLSGADLRPIIRQRKATYARELRRRHIPRILLSDGTEPDAPRGVGPLAAGALAGTPASAGVITGPTRVVLDPEGAHLEPGEILVAPSTDPGWTPLFLTAGGLVMEMGGPMSHGAVVAREYGIPAVVGVPGATERLITGQRVTVDGGAGTVTPAGPAG